MITKTYTLTALALVTALPLFAQHQVSLQAGIGMYSTPDTYVYDAVSESGSVFLTGNSNLADFVADPASTLAYQYRLSPRFRLAAQASYLRFKGIDGKEAFSSRSVNGGPPTIVSLASPRSLRALRLDGLVWSGTMYFRRKKQPSFLAPAFPTCTAAKTSAPITSSTSTTKTRRNF